MDLREHLQQAYGTTYDIERELGGGGMSRVFVANEKRLNRKVVIKVLSTERAAGVNAERFEREIQLAASLQQANIVPILAAGETDGLPFYTMPFVEGESLRARLATEGPLPVGVVASVLRDVAKALSYAHGRGVVHRDIKPDNVLLSHGTAVVTDFGIAKALSDARTSAEGATLTQVGTSLGTPAYMAPEQAAGDPAVDHRADIYALGCMAYELLTARTPFHDRTPARMLAAHVTEAPPPPSQFRPGIPAPLEQLVMRCLEKEPALRPQSGNEIVQALDGVASGSTGVLPAIAPLPSLGRTIGLYAAALIAVAIVARASTIALGVPDWVFPGALLVMLLGLPVVLFTWYAQRLAGRAASTTPALTPGGSPAPPDTMTTLALKAAPRLTMRKAWLGGAAALGGFVVLVAAFMILRALGIGPAGSLLAAGQLEDRGRLIVTAFPSPDSSLGTLVTEAVRTNLGQSRVVSIMPPVAIAAALQRMQRPPTTPLNLELAREIAQREGVKAIVDGAIQAIGNGYILSLRLVSTDSARTLAAFQETASDPEEILRAIDNLTRRLRGKIGESLRDVRVSPPLEQVTTPSLEALRIYAEAAQTIDMGGNPIEAAERLREAVRIDTGFAMAWRKLGVALNNAGFARERVDSALDQAYRFRDRLSERERLMAEGTYFQLGPGRDRRRAIRAYEALLAVDPTETGAANNLGNILSGRRDFARAESLFRAQVEGGRATSQNYTNLIGALFNGGKIDEAERFAREYRERYPGTPFAMTAPANWYYQRGQIDSMQILYDSLAKQQNVIVRINGLAGLANLSVLRGRIDDLMRYSARIRPLQQSLGQPPNHLFDSLQLSQLDLIFFDDTTRAVQRMDAALRAHDIETLPFLQRPYLALISFYASAGEVSRARALLAKHDAEIPDSTLRRIREPSRHGAVGVIAMAEGRYQDAVREFWRADTTYDGPDGSCSICVLDDIGYAWSRAGAADSALHYWEKYLATPYMGRQGFEAGQKPLMLKRMAELYEAKGDFENAAKRYREFIALWERADPRLQEKVADARERLRRMANVEGR
ncbi:MAG TPA: protein kinase [Gemmatimonadaceae bacterium]|nr:protein kinase [Gemmatimonadaceae bacterium]